MKIKHYKEDIEELQAIIAKIYFIKSKSNKMIVARSPRRSAERKQFIANLTIICSRLESLHQPILLDELETQSIDKVLSCKKVPANTYRDAVEIFYGNTLTDLLKEKLSQMQACCETCNTLKTGPESTAKNLKQEAIRWGYKGESISLGAIARPEDMQQQNIELIEKFTTQSTSESIEDSEIVRTLLTSPTEERVNDELSTTLNIHLVNSNPKSKDWSITYIEAVNQLVTFLDQGIAFQYNDENFSKLCMLIISASEAIVHSPALTNLYQAQEVNVLKTVRNNICHAVYSDSSCLSEIYMAVGIILYRSHEIKEQAVL